MGRSPEFPEQDDQFNRALLEFAWTVHRKVMQALLATNAVDLNATAGVGFTALHLAAMGDVIEGDQDVVGPTS